MADTTHMVFRLRYYRSDTTLKNFKGEPSDEMMLSGYYPVSQLANWLAETIRRIEEESNVPIIYRSIEFAASHDLLP